MSCPQPAPNAPAPSIAARLQRENGGGGRGRSPLSKLALRLPENLCPAAAAPSRLRLRALRAVGGAGRPGWTIAPLLDVVVELGAVPGHAQPLQEGAELVGLLLQLAQRLATVLVEGAVAGLVQAAQAA